MHAYLLINIIDNAWIGLHPIPQVLRVSLESAGPPRCVQNSADDTRYVPLTGSSRRPTKLLGPTFRCTPPPVTFVSWRFLHRYRRYDLSREREKGRVGATRRALSLLIVSTLSLVDNRSRLENGSLGGEKIKDSCAGSGKLGKVTDWQQLGMFSAQNDSSARDTVVAV